MILELIVIGITPDGPPGRECTFIYIFSIHWGFPSGSLLHFRFAHCIMGLQDVLVGPVSFRVGVFWYVFAYQGRDTVIRFRSVCNGLSMGWKQLLLRKMALWIAGWLGRLTLMANLKIAIKNSQQDKQFHSVRIRALDSIQGNYRCSSRWWHILRSAERFEGVRRLLDEFTYEVACFCAQTPLGMGEW